MKALGEQGLDVLVEEIKKTEYNELKNFTKICFKLLNSISPLDFFYDRYTQIYDKFEYQFGLMFNNFLQEIRNKYNLHGLQTTFDEHTIDIFWFGTDEYGLNPTYTGPSLTKPNTNEFLFQDDYDGFYNYLKMEIFDKYTFAYFHVATATVAVYMTISEFFDL